MFLQITVHVEELIQNSNKYALHCFLRLLAKTYIYSTALKVVNRQQAHMHRIKRKKDRGITSIYHSGCLNRMKI